jgi:hypothetical protein
MLLSGLSRSAQARSALTGTLAAALAGAVAGAAALAAVLTTAPALAGPGRAGSALTGAPTIGTCSTMTPVQGAADADKSTPVSCKKAHTARVAGVAKLPASLDWTASKRAIYRVVANRCAPQLFKVLGGSARARDTTAYNYYWFEPTKAQRAQGARWVSCSIFLQHGTKLASLPNNRTPMVPRGKHADSIARCLTKRVFNTTCDHPHAWRATGTFTLKAARRPGVKALNKTATRKCLPYVDPHKFYRFTYPDVDTWAVGDHTVVCYTRTGK